MDRRNQMRGLAPWTFINTETVDPEVPPATGSGEAMPTTSPSGWVLKWSQDFNVNCSEGNFLTAYSRDYDAGTAVGGGGVRAYPNTYKDTRTRDHPDRNSYYDPNVFSVQDSFLRERIYTDGTGKVHVAAPVPVLPSYTMNVSDPEYTGIPSKWGDVRDGRFAMRARSDVLPLFKVAWLLWPRSGGNTTGSPSGVGGNGEIDFPECDLNGTDYVDAFMHRQNGTTGGDQYSPAAGTTPEVRITDAGWHTYVMEWMHGNIDGTGGSMKFFIDGVQFGTTQTSRVPATPMHWVLQTESHLGATNPDPATTGYVYIDWLVYWAPA